MPAANQFGAHNGWLADRDVINGNNNAKFYPTNNVTSQATAAVLYRSSVL